MRDATNAVLPDELGDRTIAKHPSGRRGEHQIGIVGQLAGLLENFDGTGRQGHAVRAGHLHADGGRRRRGGLELELVQVVE